MLGEGRQSPGSGLVDARSKGLAREGRGWVSTSPDLHAWYKATDAHDRGLGTLLFRYCPKCPKDFPDCFNQNPSWQELQDTHKRVHAVFDSDPDQPPVMDVA